MKLPRPSVSEVLRMRRMLQGQAVRKPLPPIWHWIKAQLRPGGVGKKLPDPGIHRARPPSAQSRIRFLEKPDSRRVGGRV